MGQVLLLSGPEQSERAARVDALLREGGNGALLLTPTSAYAALRREKLLLEGVLPGAWGNPVREFNDFARHLLEAEGLFVQLLDDFERLLIVEGCIARMISEDRLCLFDEKTEVPRERGITAAPVPPGLARHLLRVITQLKQAAIEPEEFETRLKKTGATPMDIAVAGVYAAYQEALKATGQYDVPGLYWEAELHCTESTPKALRGVKLLALDGFDDFTPSQFRLIASLARHVEQLVFGLNLDPSPSRADLYTRSIETASQLRERFEVVEDPVRIPEPERYSAFAAASVFWRDPPSAPAGLAEDLEIHTYADAIHEIEGIGRRVKTLLLDGGVAPERIAVVFRDLDAVADTVRTVFREFGLPCRMRHRPRLRQSALGSFLRRFIEAGTAWRREAVLDVLLSPWSRGGAALPEATPMLARMARIIGGFEEWRDRLEALRVRIEKGTGDEIEELLAHFPEAAAAVAELQQGIARLWALWQEWPDTATQRQYAGLLEGILNELGVEATVLQHLAPEMAGVEHAALDALYDLLRILTEYEGEIQLSRADFFERFEIGLRETSFQPPSDRGGVFIGDPAAVRNLDFDYMFFGGLVEGVMPASRAVSAVYGDMDLERLRHAGIVLEGRREHNARERLLFHHVLAAARRGLYLSWRVHKDGGGEATPSAFLTELQSIFAGWADIEAAAPRAGSFVPGPMELASVRELRNAAFLHEASLQKAFPEYCAEAALGASIEQLRQNDTPFGEYDGMLCDPAIVAQIAERFGMAHIFSVNQLEAYLACPFRFFTERILRVGETDVPAAEFDPRRYGAILHRALETFHKRYAGKAIPEIDPEEALAAAHEAVAEAFQALAWAEITAPPGLVAAEAGRMKAQIKRYLSIESKGADRWKPTYFEAAFGPLKGPSGDPPSTPEPFELDTPEGKIRFAGRIDRIDLDQNMARIIDYKSGGAPPAAEIKQGLSLQLTLYSWVLEQFLLANFICEEAWFISVGNKKNSRNALKLRGITREYLEKNAQVAITRAVQGIRAAQFPPVPATDKTCDYCPHQAACRFSKRRIERKAPASSVEWEEDKGDEE